ncbi:MAG: hypothetical protein JO297_21115 [Nitrososphaeraceae archaeon]|nr:hypothetical protein [Nitrososphaeraceae archaeon]
MQVVHGLHGDKFDLILHMSSGTVEAAEAFVSYLRTKFSDIRVIIPHAAMSTATMIACAANKIVMGKHSFLGPIHPQIVLPTPVGNQSVSAQDIIDQFRRARKERQDEKNQRYLILNQYSPALLIQCENAISLPKTLVSEWLQKYMFAGRTDEDNVATISKSIAAYLTNHAKFKSHARHINRDEAKSKGLIIEDLESDQKLQDLALSVFHATMHTFDGGVGLLKIIENHLGSAFAKED